MWKLYRICTQATTVSANEVEFLEEFETLEDCFEYNYDEIEAICVYKIDENRGEVPKSSIDIIELSQEIGQIEHGSVDNLELYMCPEEDQYDVVYLAAERDDNYGNIIWFATKKELSDIDIFMDKRISI